MVKIIIEKQAGIFKKTGENEKTYPCPVCHADMDLNEINCLCCGYKFPEQDEESGLEEFQDEKE